MHRPARVPPVRQDDVPEIMLADVRTQIVVQAPPLDLRIEDTERAFFFHARRGDFLLDAEGWPNAPVLVTQGSSVGFDCGRPQRWRAVPAAGLPSVELFVSNIPRAFGVLQHLQDSVVIVPPEAEPYATILRQAVDLHTCELRSGAGQNSGVMRRCAEICLMQLIRYVRCKISEQPDVPPGLAHDARLLRAWTAYFAEPRRRWTVQALADAAGLGRTTFSQRFQKVFGAPPLQTLMKLRLDQAERMLRDSQTPLIEIAFTIGYNSEAAFAHAFHRKHGIPPGRFRLLHGYAGLR